MLRFSRRLPLLLSSGSSVWIAPEQSMKYKSASTPAAVAPAQTPPAPGSTDLRPRLTLLPGTLKTPLLRGRVASDCEAVPRRAAVVFTADSGGGGGGGGISNFSNDENNGNSVCSLT
jgi:hypothetical protein